MNQDTLLQIAKDYGSPVYVYDAHKMEVQYKRLTAGKLCSEGTDQYFCT